MKNYFSVKSTAGSVIMAALLVMVGCTQFETAEPALDNSQSVEVLNEQANGVFFPNARISYGNVEPVIIDGENNGGNRTCAEVAAAREIPNFQYSSGRINYEGSAFSKPFPAGFTITTDGTNVSWSFTPPPGYCLDAIAFIVKGSNAANVYYYGPDIYEDSRLTSPNNASGGAAGLSNLTICYTLRLCGDVKECFRDETAWAFGSKYITRGNWATYVQYSNVVKTVKLFAGQTYDIGNVTFTPSGDDVEIKIELNEFGRFQDIAENVKIQGYALIPAATNPSPGLFTTHKAKATESPYTVVVPRFNYYGVHVDAARAVECPTD
ncbi:hypothetical protein [Algoriphagus ratkowskyi]|nr:hypothetical protein [Algoriphagus ratkowskyi]TXD76906.1 hypothetical protein ESW18_13940 [Algoriphagus ratkowskyi]